MNKTKLEVIRINEDVIATSGNVCEHIAADVHRNITSVETDYAFFSEYTYSNNKLHIVPDNTEGEMSGVDTGWWHSYDDGITFTKCDENCEHPIG